MGPLGAKSIINKLGWVAGPAVLAAVGIVDWSLSFPRPHLVHMDPSHRPCGELSFREGWRFIHGPTKGQWQSQSQGRASRLSSVLIRLSLGAALALRSRDGPVWEDPNALWKEPTISVMIETNTHTRAHLCVCVCASVCTHVLVCACVTVPTHVHVCRCALFAGVRVSVFAPVCMEMCVMLVCTHVYLCGDWGHLTPPGGVRKFNAGAEGQVWGKGWQNVAGTFGWIRTGLVKEFPPDLAEP